MTDESMTVAELEALGLEQVGWRCDRMDHHSNPRDPSPARPCCFAVYRLTDPAALIAALGERDEAIRLLREMVFAVPDTLAERVATLNAALFVGERDDAAHPVAPPVEAAAHPDGSSCPTDRTCPVCAMRELGA